MFGKLTLRLLPVLTASLCSPVFADFQFEFNDHTYQVITTGLSWTEAAESAKSKTLNGAQGYLVRIDDSNENTEIINQLMANIPANEFANTSSADGGDASYVWIGANDIATEGNWIWDDNGTQFWQGDFDGAPVAGLYNNWGLEPDDFDGQDAAGIALTEWPLGFGDLGSHGQWNDIDVNNNLYYIVEFDPVDTFRINAGLNDAWYYPTTSGQGFFITVFPELGFLSLAWFTYDTELPAENATANLGDPGHRWITAGGFYGEKQAVLDIEMTSGGLFDAASEVQRTDPVGSDGQIVLTFQHCNSGTIEYDIPSINRQGTIPIQRVTTDNVALCEALSADQPAEIRIE